MPYFNEKQIQKAKEIDLLEYLKLNNPSELVYDSKNTYCLKSHDSLKINNGMWYWFSRGIGGVSALDYLIKVENFSFTDAVSHLINQKGLEKTKISEQILTEKERKDRLVLPKKSVSNDKVISYLLSRGISKSIIDECISKRLIYQEFPKNNVVFVGYDENDYPRFASVRGTNDSRFMHDCYGSDKQYSFKLSSIILNNEVHLFESAIDLLSYATIKDMHNCAWDEENLLSLAGIYKPSSDIKDSKIPKTLTTYLKNNRNIDTIILHLDNDEAGRNATKALINLLSGSYKVYDNPPLIGKDFNDFLCYKKGIYKKK